MVEEGGADVESKDSRYGQTPLSYAAQNGHLEIIKFLVRESGADVESKSNNGQTPLSWAAANRHLEIVKFLVEEGGADVESKDSRYGRTPLSYAAENGHLEIVKFLVEGRGANVESKDEEGNTALDLARQGLKYSWKEERCKAVAAWLESRITTYEADDRYH